MEVRETGQDSGAAPSWFWVVPLTLAQALMIVACDFAGAFRAIPFWCGVSNAEWLGLGCLVMMLWGGAITVSACALLAFRLSRGSSVWSAPVAAFLSMMVLLAAVHWLAPPLEDSPATPLLAAVGVCAMTLICVLLAKRGMTPMTPLALSLVACLVGAFLAMERFGRAIVYSEHVAFWTQRVGLIWAGVMLALAFLVFALRGARRAPWRRAAAVTLAALGTPFLADAGLWFLAPKDGPPGDKTNLVFITCDALRADFCSTLGGETPTPAMDRLSERGALFERCYTMAPWTVPSFHSLFSSQYPVEWQPAEDLVGFVARVQKSYFSLEQPTLAERLRERDYATAMMTSHLTLYEPQRLSRGYDVVALPSMEAAEYRTIFAQAPRFRAALARWRPSADRLWPINCSRRLTAYAKTFLTWNRRRPFFLWIHFMDPHSPYCPPESYRSGEGRISYFPVEEVRHSWDPPFVCREEDLGLMPTLLHWNLDMDTGRALYRGEVEYVDACVGEVVDRLGACGLLDSTCLVLSADHGESFCDHGGMGHPHCIQLYDEVMHVPLVIAAPGIPAQRVEQPFSFIDLLPTMADIVGLEPSWYWQGQSAAPALRKNEHDSLARPVYGGGNRGDIMARYQMVVSGWDKIIRNLDTGELELYDLKADPHERTNLAEDVPAKAKQLESLLDTWEKELPSPGTLGESPQGSETPHGDLSERLGAMGYL